MPRRVHRIDSLPADAPWAGGMPPEGSPDHPRMIRALDRVLAVQRPAVLAHLRSVRLRNPDAGGAELVRMLERRYLATVATGGAAVGATAVVPGITTGVTLALSGVETVAFVEATALFAQSLAEVHGIRVENPERARALVLTLMLGTEGVDLVTQLARQASGRGPSRSTYWGELITGSLPRAAVGPLVDRLKTVFIRRFAATAGASWVGKALPFGVGAVVGGVGNGILGRRVVVSSRRAFGVPPVAAPAGTAPPPGAHRIEHIVGGGIRRAAGTVGAVGARATGAVGATAERAKDAAAALAARRGRARPDQDADADVVPPAEGE